MSDCPTDCRSLIPSRANARDAGPAHLSDRCDCDLNPVTGYGLCDACRAADSLECELCGEPDTDDNPVGLTRYVGGGEDRVRVCLRCQQEDR